jgi:hypothetical protein
MLTSLALLPFLPLLMAQSAAPPRFVVPNAPDVTIKTRRMADREHSDVVTEIVYVKGARQRRELTFEGPLPRINPGDGTDGRHTYKSIEITQCAERRMLLLNPAAKTYVYRAILDPATFFVTPPNAALQTPPREMTLGPIVTVTVDAVDTGERRQYGSYVARHVITTRKTEPGPNAKVHRRASVQSQDGWYIDVPLPNCIEWGGEVTTSLSLSSTPPDPVQFKQRGKARRGYPIAETDRWSDGQKEIVSTIELLEISDATLDDALFTPPPDYRAALPRPDGSYDLSKPDTVMNRVESYRGVVAAWVDYLLRNGLFGILPGTQPPARY